MNELENLYQEVILDHQRHPRNYARLPTANRQAEGANPLCGDRITLMLGLDESGVVDEVAFTGRGCAISQASASMLTDRIRGQSLAEIAHLSRQDVLDELGIDISPARLKCALLSLETLRRALADRVVWAAPVEDGAA